MKWDSTYLIGLQKYFQTFGNIYKMTTVFDWSIVHSKLVCLIGLPKPMISANILILTCIHTC